jgi:hypothetical protein
MLAQGEEEEEEAERSSHQAEVQGVVVSGSRAIAFL